jgi:hypothetical protein
MRDDSECLEAKANLLWVRTSQEIYRMLESKFVNCGKRVVYRTIAGELDEAKYRRDQYPGRIRYDYRMSLQRLRRVLSTPVIVQVHSDTNIVARVAAAAARRAHLNPKAASAYPPFATQTALQFRALDFLRKIGELTTPRNINLARLSASWATRRYFWAVHDSRKAHGAAVNFRLSADARTIDRHQKTLLSDEFGMGFAGLVTERLLSASDFVDVDFAVTTPRRFFGATAIHRRRPDFLMWGTGTPLFVVECKGSQTSERGVITQLRRGLEQLPSITVGHTQTVSLVIATHLFEVKVPGRGGNSVRPLR